MRLIGYFDTELHAVRASGVLGSHGIQSQVEPEDGLRWALWVHGEDDLERARHLVAGFRAAPDDPRFRVVSAAGESEPPPRPAAGRRAEPAADWEGGPSPRFGLATVAVMVVCGALAYVTGLTSHHPWVDRLQISEVPFRLGARWALFLPEVRQGEVWRLFTPAILHFGWPHLLFNLWTFWDLGQAIERRRGTWGLVGLVVGFGVVSNLGQYLAQGPFFGGMSGVIYGLLGYVWMLGKYRPSAGLALHPQIVLMMLVWFAICVSGALKVPVANTAHGVGLVAGVLWGRWVAARGR